MKLILETDDGNQVELTSSDIDAPPTEQVNIVWWALRRYRASRRPAWGNPPVVDPPADSVIEQRANRREIAAAYIASIIRAAYPDVDRGIPE